MCVLFCIVFCLFAYVWQASSALFENNFLMLFFLYCYAFFFSICLFTFLFGLFLLMPPLCAYLFNIVMMYCDVYKYRCIFIEFSWYYCKFDDWQCILFRNIGFPPHSSQHLKRTEKSLLFYISCKTQQKQQEKEKK